MPAIYSTPELGPEELRAIQMLENLKTRIRAATGSDGLTRRWLGPLRRNLAARHIQGSNSIEGIDVSMDDAHELVVGEEPIDEKSEAWLALQGYKRAMTLVLQMAEDPTFVHSEANLKALHYMMLEHDMSKRPGRWRVGSVFVLNEESEKVVYEGPDFELVPGLVAELISRLSSEKDLPGVVQAAMAHLNLAMIHPFKDGNGRMARCLQSLVLARTGTLSPVFLSIEEYLGAFTLDYYNALAGTGLGVWNPTRDARAWVRFCLSAHYFQGSRIALRIKTVHEAWQRIEAAVTALGLPDRSISPLIEAFLGRKLRNLSYRNETEVSEQVATADLGKLVAAGFLLPKGERRGRTYERGPRLQKMREETRFHVDFPHPFERPDEAEVFSAQGLQREAMQGTLFTASAE